MSGRIKLTRIFGIDINIHVTFFLLLALFFLFFGVKGLVLILGVFLFVTIHELCHSLMAAYFGIKVKSITLLPIGGIASMNQMPKKPYQELLISLAGPLSNVAVVIIFYYPLLAIIGKENLMYPFMVMTGHAKYTGQFNVFAHIYWINLFLAVFNMIPAFPMDGGRILRAILSYRMGHRDATKIAVRLGHIFALLFAYFGIVYGHVFLIIIAVFIFMAASSEGLQVEVTETIKNFKVRDILSTGSIFLEENTPLHKVMEIMFHSHHEDFPVVEGTRLVGLITRREVINGVHEKGRDALVKDIMRTDVPAVQVETRLHDVQKLMQKYNTSAMPVVRSGHVIGIISIADINRIYVMVHES